jgi:hypothetical protein
LTTIDAQVILGTLEVILPPGTEMDLKNASDSQPTTLHSDTQGQSTPVGAPDGHQAEAGIRNWYPASEAAWRMRPSPP